MANKPKIIAFCGSLRQGSFNKKILDLAIAGAQEAGAIVTYLNLKEYPLPIYDQDIEDSEGIPENAKKLKSLLRQHQAFLIASPEYNSGYSGVLKNAIDWASRPESPTEPFLECFMGKIAALISASPSDLGGLRGLAQLRTLLMNIYVTVIPLQRTLPAAHNAFDANGHLKDQAAAQKFKDVGTHLAEITAKFG